MSFVYPINLPQPIYVSAVVKGQEQVLPVVGWSPSVSGFMSHIQLYCKEVTFDGEESYEPVMEQTVQWWRVGLEGEKQRGTGGLLEALCIFKRKPHVHLHKWEHVISVSTVNRALFTDEPSEYEGCVFYNTYNLDGERGGYFVREGSTQQVYKVHRPLYGDWIVSPLKNTVLEFEFKHGGERGRLRLIEVVDILVPAQ